MKAAEAEEAAAPIAWARAPDPFGCHRTRSTWAGPQRFIGACTRLLGVAAMTQSISGGIGAVTRSGSMVVQPVGPSSWTLHGRLGPASRDLAQASLAVRLPQPNGGRRSRSRPTTRSELFLQAITEPDAIIRIDNDVALDLSHRENLHIAPGVTIIGARSTTQPGPKLFTTTFPTRLFIIEQADDVSISGIRLQGAEMGTADADAEISNGISVISSVNVKIFNNETIRLAGCRGGGARPAGPHQSRQSRHRACPGELHPPQPALPEEGYGVATYESAYALIEKNLFDYNRHAIASTGDPGTGYYAHSNLVLWNGGMNNGTFNTNTHMFDVHGTQDCWDSRFYCGPAGEKFDIRHNTILYDAGTAIKVRGEPSIGAVRRQQRLHALATSGAVIWTTPRWCRRPATTSTPRTTSSASSSSTWSAPPRATSTPTGPSTRSSRPVRPGGTGTGVMRPAAAGTPI